MAVPWASMSDEPFTVFLNAMKALVTTREGVLRSQSGRAAVVVSLEALRATRDLEIRLDATVRGKKNVAVLLTDTDTAALAEELRELSTACDLVAVPKILAKASLHGYSPRGQIIQHVDPALSDTFEVWEHRATPVDLLTRDAPVDLDEGPDNLTGRATWFKKRHARDP